MKIITTVGIFFLILFGQACVESESYRPLRQLYSLKTVTKIDIKMLSNKEGYYEVVDKRNIHSFLEALRKCKEMPQIDMRGSHELKIYSENHIYVLEAYRSKDMSFIRIPEYKGNDLYFMGGKELQTILQIMGV